MTIIVGIDPSSAKIAGVAIDTLTGTYVVKAAKLYPKGTTKQTPASFGAAIDFMRDFVREVGNDARTRLAYIEPPMVGRGGVMTAIKQAYVGGIIRGCLVEAGFTVYDAPLTSWRSGFMGVRAGKGRTTKIVKAETALGLKVRDPKLHSLVQHDGDLIDAGAIALYGVDQVRKAAGFTPAQPSGVPVRDSGPDAVLRPPRVRPPVRRR